MNITEIIKKIGNGEIKEFNISRYHNSDDLIIEIRSEYRKAQHTIPFTWIRDNDIPARQLDIAITGTINEIIESLKQ